VGATVEALQEAEWGAPLLSRAPKLGRPVPVPGFGTEPDGGTR
jgi:aspartyl-tRNA(Asn)/glutamyl-tRNA(Gln) amidotransferase subunit A